METFASAIANEPGTGQRIEWIDSAKTIGITLMIVDHSLIYFGHESHWSRFSITRMAEPLIVLSLFHVVSIRGRCISIKRWLQIVRAAAIETGLHSYREGYLYFGILTSIAVVVPFAVTVARSATRFQYGIVVSASLFSLIAIEGEDFHVDYGPFLLLAQIPAAAQLARHRACTFTNHVAFSSTFIGASVLAGLGLPISMNVWTLLIGQPAAVALLYVLRRLNWNSGERNGISILARWPLSAYLGHLIILQMAVWFTAGSASEGGTSQSSPLGQERSSVNYYRPEYRR